MSFADIFRDELAKEFQQRLTRQSDEASEKTNDYAQKLETATGADLFKYFLLINVAAIEKYITQTRIQAELSFRLSKRVALWAFVLIAGGVALAIYSAFFNKGGGLTPAVVATLAGVFTQLISGVFFYLYNRTLQQFNLFGDKISAAQRLAMSLLVNGSIADSAKRDDSSAGLATALLHAGVAPVSPSPQPQPSPSGSGGA
jgi:hypothetical protein